MRSLAFTPSVVVCFGLRLIYLKVQAPEVPPEAPPPCEGELVGRGRQKGAPGPFSAEGTIEYKVYIFMWMFFCIYASFLMS